jgi:MFS superfamily sulfate permease-like transporter
VTAPALWSDELRGGLNATAAMLPFTLSYGFIAFGVTGPAATQAGLTASVASVVFGGLLMTLVSRTALPCVSPSASSCLILASAVAAWLRDPSLQPDAEGGLARLLAMSGLTVMVAGLLQVSMGLLRVGSLVRYVPQPVLAGFMNGVAILIVLSQVAPALGLLPAQLAGEGFAALASWNPAALAVASVTAVGVWIVGRTWPRLPAALVALVLASAAVWTLDQAFGAPAPGATLGIAMIGPLQAKVPLPLELAPLLGDAGTLLLDRHAGKVLTTGLLIALVGALETVLNLATIDQRMHARSDPNRALTAVGLVNIALGVFSALPVVYLRLRALATLAGGGRGVRSVVAGSVLLGLLSLLGLPLLHLCPRPVVAGLLVMLAWSLVDPWSLALLRGRSAQAGAGSITDRGLSLAVVAAVCAVTVLWGFVAGVALGVLLSFVILVRALNRSLIRLRYTAAATPSRRVYAPPQERVLASARPGIVVLELEGALFFGNVERLGLEVESIVREAGGTAPLTTLVLDLRRVSTVDASGAVMLGRLRETLAARGVALCLAGVTQDNRHGESLRAHGVLDAGGAGAAWALHVDADRAIEAAEQAGLAQAGLPPRGTPVPLAQCELFAGLDAATFERVQALLPERMLSTGERLFAQGDAGDALYVLCSGSISVLDAARRQRFVSVSPGMTFGELAVLDGGGRTADAVADEPSLVRTLPAGVMQQLEREAPEIAARLYRNLARHLAVRLREASGAWRRAAG